MQFTPLIVAQLHIVYTVLAGVREDLSTSYCASEGAKRDIALLQLPATLITPDELSDVGQAWRWGVYSKHPAYWTHRRPPAGDGVPQVHVSFQACQRAVDG